MKCVLINPAYIDTFGKAKSSVSSVIPPTGLAYLAAVLEENSYEVKILDAQADELQKEAIKKIIRKEWPDVVGITSATTVFLKALEISKLTKEVNSEIKVIHGGPHPTAVPEEPLASSDVDFVIVGEGEYTLLDLMNHFSRKSPELKDIKGVYYRSNGNIVFTGPRPLIKNLDELPFPARHLLPMNKYFSTQSKGKRFANIITSRGCPGKCVYCNKKIFGRVYRTRSPENIISELQYLVGEYNIDQFNVSDDTFLLNKRRAEKICELLKKEKLDLVWKCGNGVRVDTVSRSLLKAMKDSGCYSLSYGLESGSQRILDNIGKGITLKQSEDAVRWTKEAGIFTVGFFMIGNLGENKKTIQTTIDFAKRLDVDIAQFAILVPYPGTQIRDIIEKEGSILLKGWDEYSNISGEATFEHGELTKELMDKMYRKAYREFYMRPSYMLRALGKLRNFKDIENNVRALFTLTKMIR